jgi:ubiquitin carboxyl-terminal hydrolase L3
MALEECSKLEEAHSAAALQGDSMPPMSAEDEVDFHYLCIVRSHDSGRLYELDGDKKGPIDLGPMADHDDLLSETALRVVRAYIQREEDSVGFGLLALAPDVA